MHATTEAEARKAQCPALVMPAIMATGLHAAHADFQFAVEMRRFPRHVSRAARMIQFSARVMPASTATERHVRRARRAESMLQLLGSVLSGVLRML